MTWTATHERQYQTEAEILATIQTDDVDGSQNRARRATRPLILARKAIKAGDLAEAERQLDEVDRICPMPE